MGRGLSLIATPKPPNCQTQAADEVWRQLAELMSPRAGHIKIGFRKYVCIYLCLYLLLLLLLYLSICL